MLIMGSLCDSLPEMKDVFSVALSNREKNVCLGSHQMSKIVLPANASLHWWLLNNGNRESTA